MIKINGQTKRNLQEQVLKNKEDIEDLKSGRTNPSFSDITGEPSDNSNLNNALNSKVDKITGKGLSTNDFSNADKSKLDGINMSQKQDLLTAEQMAAVDSGMTAADVTAIGALITQMLTKSPLLEAGTNITLTTLGSGKIRIDATGGGGGGTWGSITGSLSNQIDLFNALNEKLGVNALTPYRTAANQDTIDTSIRDLATSETNRAIAKENELATAISGCLTSAKLVEGQSIDITVNPDGTVVIACSIEAMELKGSVPTYADLPTTARNGDTYIVASNYNVYTYTTGGWVQSGAAFDVSLFYTKTESDNRFAAKATTLAGYGITNAYTKTESDGKYASATGLATEIGDREIADTALGQRITNIELGYLKDASVSGGTLTLTKQNDTTVTFTADLSAYRTSADQDTIDTALQNNIDAKSTVTVSNTGTSTDEVKYITINGTEKKLAGGSAPTNYVTTDTTQNISAAKTFTDGIAGHPYTIINNEYVGSFNDNVLAGTMYGVGTIQNRVYGTTYVLTLPNNTGALATSTDIASALGSYRPKNQQDIIDATKVSNTDPRIKSVSISGNNITFTKQDNTTELYQPGFSVQGFYDGIFPVGFEYTGITCPGVPTGVTATWTEQSSLNNRYPMVLSTTQVKTLQIQMLPNISGYFAIAPSTSSNLGDTLPIKKIGGAFYNADSLGDTAWRIDDINADYTRTGNPQTVGFNARNSNTIYQDGADVKPYTYTIKHWKRTA